MAATVEKSSDADLPLQQQIEDLRRTVAALQVENKMFECFISRMEDPQDLVAPQMERAERLTLAQKCHVGQKVLNETTQELQKIRQSPEKLINHYQASIKEADIRLAEIKKESHEFDRDVAKTLREKAGTVSGAQKAVRYIESGIKAKNSRIEKLRLKNRALRAQTRKQQLQLRQREEVLLWIDLEHLKTENQQCLELIATCNQELQRLKVQAGNAQQVLNSYKKKLQIQTSESEKLSSDIAAREGRLVKIAAETQHAEEERAKAEDLNRKLKTQLADYRVPDVLEYISAKTWREQLQHNVKAWERKVEVKEMELKTLKKAWNKRRASAGAATTNGEQLTLGKTHRSQSKPTIQNKTD